LQTQRQSCESFQQFNVVKFVVISCIIAALGLHFVIFIPSSNFNATDIQPIIQSPCVQTIANESRIVTRLSVPPVNKTHQSVVGLSVRQAEAQQQKRLVAHALAPLSRSQFCTTTSTIDKKLGNNVADKMLTAAPAPAPLSISDGHEKLALQAKPAIHFEPHKRTIDFVPLIHVQDRSPSMAETHMSVPASTLQGSTGNVFPYGQCTWWANQRFHQLHGIFVPWRTNANAYQWAARAIDFGWRVSGTPTIGSIMVLQPGVGGAYEYGHVGVVEQVLSNGRVIASSMNWGRYPTMVTASTYVLRSGVSFISNF
jgi:surface antigen